MVRRRLLILWILTGAALGSSACLTPSAHAGDPLTTEHPESAIADAPAPSRAAPLVGKKKPATTKPAVGDKTGPKVKKRGRRGKVDPAAVELTRQRKLAEFRRSQAACARGDLEACLVLAGMYDSRQESSSMVPVDRVKANQLFGRVCDGGVGKGCYRLGLNMEWGRGFVYDPALVLTTHKRACDLGVGSSCNRVVIIYLEGRGMEPDVPRALEMIEQRCGSLPVCPSLIKIYEEGFFVPRDMDRVAIMLRQMCDSGMEPGCRHLARLYREGDGVPVDVGRSDALLKRGCALEKNVGCMMYERHQERFERQAQAEKPVVACEQGDLTACVEAGRGQTMLVEHAAFNKWAPFPRASERALAYLQRACDGGVAGGCAELSWAHLWGLGVPVDAERGFGLAEPACKAGEAKGCAGAGLAYVLGHGVKAQPDKGSAMLESACSGNNRQVCGSASLKGLHTRLKQSCSRQDLANRGCEMLQVLDRRTCDMGTPRECATVAETHASARGGTFAPKTARALLRKACDGGDVGGCVQLAWATLTQRGFPRDDPRAIEALEEACEGGSHACLKLAMAYRMGLGCTRDDGHAHQALKKGCEGSTHGDLLCRDGPGALKEYFLKTCRRGLSHRGCEVWRGAAASK